MANNVQSRRRGFPWRMIGWSVPALLLLLPLIAMQFTHEVNWTLSDFIFAAVLFGSVGLGFEFIVRRSGNLFYRLGAALAVVAAFLTIWVNGAVGMIGDEDNVYNLLFFAVPLIALIVGALGRFRPAGMMRAMVAAAVAQVALGAFGVATDLLGALFSMGFGGIWLLAAILFWNAARERAEARATPEA